MTQRRNLELHRENLAELREIMNSMKTLAYMETRKLTRFLDAQHDVVRSIEDIAGDLLSFYPETLPEATQATPVYLLLGSERGFCGDFNHALLSYLESTLTAQEQPFPEPLLIAVGHKLNTLLAGDARVAATIDGASIVEEVTTALNQVVNELLTLQDKHKILTVYVLYHGKDGIVMQRLLPPFQGLLQKPERYAYPPALNESPEELLLALTEHYLFAALHEILYSSLMTENQHRVTHLDGAVNHLDDESAELTRKYNAQRQEEIIEEIEVILLSAASLGVKAGKQERKE